MSSDDKEKLKEAEVKEEPDKAASKSKPEEPESAPEESAEPEAKESEAEPEDPEAEESEAAEEESEAEESAASEASEAEPEESEAEQAEEPGAEEPGSSDEPPQQTIDEMDEGWPKSWIVTTAILGIVAIIIIARLVGQSWRQDLPKPPNADNLPQAKKMAKRPPGAKGIPGKRPLREQPKLPGKLLLQMEGIIIPPGNTCLGKDKKLHPIKKDDDRPQACRFLINPRTRFRVDVSREERQQELFLNILPVVVDHHGALSALMMSRKDGRSWIGGTLTHDSDEGVIFKINNYIPDPVKVRFLRVQTDIPRRRPPGEVISRVQIQNAELSKKGWYCLGTDKKIHEVKQLNKGKPDEAVEDKLVAPEVCKFTTAGADLYYMEIQQGPNQPGYHLRLRPFSMDGPELLQVTMSGSPGEGAQPSILSGKIGEIADMVVMLEIFASQKITFKDFLFVSKKLKR